MGRGRVRTATPNLANSSVDHITAHTISLKSRPKSTIPQRGKQPTRASSNLVVYTTLEHRKAFGDLQSDLDKFVTNKHTNEPPPQNHHCKYQVRKQHTRRVEGHNTFTLFAGGQKVNQSLKVKHRGRSFSVGVGGSHTRPLR